MYPRWAGHGFEALKIGHAGARGHDGSLGRAPRGSVAHIPNTIESQERFKQNSREE